MRKGTKKLRDAQIFSIEKRWHGKKIPKHLLGDTNLVISKAIIL
jgi:hypothetical protein